MCIKNDILSTLAYFDIFDYPLKRREISLFLPGSYNDWQLEAALHDLLIGYDIFRLDEFYSLQNNYGLIQKRKMDNERALKRMRTAKKAALVISKFPYVQGVAISGSLSKNCADENSNIAFFIIAAKNRLWVANFFLFFLVKFALLIKRQDIFCMNYFIDEEKLEIEEKNIYTATEIITLIPLQDNAVFENFFAANGWTKTFLPNNYLRISTAELIKRSWFRYIIETLLNNRLGNRLDSLLLKLTSERWRKKTQRKKINRNGLLFGMKTSRHFAKHNPETLQDKIILLHKKKIASFLAQSRVKQIPAN